MRDLGFRDSEIRVQVFGFRDRGSGFRIQGLGFRVSRLGTMGNYALGNYGDYGFQAKAEVRLAFRVSH